MVSAGDQELIRRIHSDLADSDDEEPELEFEDRRVDEIAGIDTARDQAYRRSRRDHFKELVRLQRELVKLRDGVVASRHRVVILFEGRDAAGKGGVIQRITQRLNPRIARVAALPAPNDRERTQWHAPIVLPRRMHHEDCVRHPLPKDPIVSEIY